MQIQRCFRLASVCLGGVTTVQASVIQVLSIGGLIWSSWHMSAQRGGAVQDLMRLQREQVWYLEIEPTGSNLLTIRKLLELLLQTFQGKGVCLVCFCHSPSFLHKVDAKCLLSAQGVGGQL